MQHLYRRNLVRIPEVQARLIELAEEYGLAELTTLAKHLGRRAAGHIAPATSSRMTEDLRGKIRELAALRPGISQVEIARRLHINPGRVSETLRGKRL